MNGFYVASANPRVGKRLAEILEYNYYHVFNPWEHQTSDVFKSDLKELDNSVSIIVIMPEKGYAFGIIVEATYAWMKGKPVYFITNDFYGKPKFMQGIATKIFNSEDGFLKALRYDVTDIDTAASIMSETKETWDQFWKTIDVDKPYRL